MPPDASTAASTAPTDPTAESLADERARFADLQLRLAPMFERIFPDPALPRTVVVVPSLSLDADVLARVTGIQHYEERLLFMLMLLKLPRTRLVVVTSVPIAPSVVDYYLSLLPGVPAAHARRRLTLLSCHDGSSEPLSAKILARPRMLARIRAAVDVPEDAHMACFNVSPLERRLALAVGVPIYGCDPDLAPLGGKSGSRRVFRAAGVPLPEGAEDLRDEDDVVKALADLRSRLPDLRRAAVKLEEGTSGEGNAVVDFAGAPAGSDLTTWLRRELPRRLRFEAEGESYEPYMAKFAEMGGIVERWIDGDKRSPSFQGRIDPLGRLAPVSTHDQILGGASGQIFLGATFPADAGYRLAIQDAGLRIGEVLRERGAIGRFGVDFVTVHEAGAWRSYAIEINLRKGGTTHPFMMLELLTDGSYDPASGRYLTPTGQERCYFATDNFRDAGLRDLLPEDLIDIAVCQGLHFHGPRQRGVVFHLIGALAQYGKIGLVSVERSLEEARVQYEHTKAVLAEEARRARP